MVKRTNLFSRGFVWAYTVRFLVPVFLLADAASAAAPDGYYDSLDLTSNATLRSTLHEVIDDHTKLPYTSSTALDTWDVVSDADSDPLNASNVLTIYKNTSYPKTEDGTTASYNREHAWPKSYGFPTAAAYPYSDAHHLFAADSSYKTSRSNLPYGTCDISCLEKVTEDYNGEGGTSGIYPGESNWREGSGSTGTWEVWEDRKGDIARAMFYMAIRYEGGTHGLTLDEEPNLELTDDLDLIATSNTGSNESVAYMGRLSVLVQWHLADPVDELERSRNEVVWAAQGNRNPFIDHPEYADYLFAGVSTPEPEVDSDGDGVYDAQDNCPFFFNPEQTNLDEDALGDVCDEDLDGDGVDDIEDVFPDNPDEAFDTDNDGIGNNADTDDDNDGLLDSEESQLGTDPLSRDSDGDGWTDLEEVEEGSDPLSRESEPELATGLPIWLLYVATQSNAEPLPDPEPLGDVIEGTFTRSSASNANMCWFSNYDGAFSGAEFYASAPPALFAGGLACGDVYEVSCKEGSEANAGAQGGCLDGTDKIKVVINDYCTECQDTQILSTDFGFYELGGSNPPDSLDAKFQRVEGDYEGNIAAVMHPDSSEWWSAVILVGSNLRIVELEFADSSETSFRQATFAGPGWYLEPIPIPPSTIIPPISLRVTAEDGSQLTFNDVITSFSGVFDTGANF